MKRPYVLRRRALAGTPAGWSDAIHPVLQQIYAARGVYGPDGVAHRLQSLLSPHALGGIDRAVDLLIEAIRNDDSILIAGDYDCDGATGTALAVRGLRLLGAKHVDYVIPNRFLHGYGLSAALVASLTSQPALIVTVDNGVASIAGVTAARARGIRVVITDHHLPGEQLPPADAMVNPNVQGDAFSSKALAGVGVMFYVLLALRARLREQGHYSARREPDLSALLDLVALGTVADLVPLDFNNRVLVEAGIKRLRAGKGCVGIHALIEASQRNAATLCASDLGYAIGPRLNAAGRLEDMRLGVECLITDDAALARRYAEQLSAINRERRELQTHMVAEAEVMAAHTATPDAIGVTLYESSWHPGIVGLVASKLKERLHRPVIAFAPASEDAPDELRGSGRSIAGFHLRDALALIDARHPGLITRFGGHAMAAGLTLANNDLATFTSAFDRVASEWLDDDQLQAVLLTDGELPSGAASLALAYQLRDAGPWGQAFPEPVFDNHFECVQCKTMGEQHWRLELRDPRDSSVHSAVMFNVNIAQPPPQHFRAAYELGINDWQGRESVRLLLRHIEAS